MVCNNLAKISISKNLAHHDRTKHVELDRHFIKKKVEAGILNLIYTPTNHQMADVKTKALSIIKFGELNSTMRMINI